MTASDADIQGAIRAAFKGPLPQRLGVAVSGGSDSLGLLHVLADLVAGTETRLFCATVDHNLRPEAANEAAHVARIAAGLGVPHDILLWQGWDGTGNLQDAARRARLDLLTGWAAGQSIPAIALAQTADDQAETLLMRLARSAGADGLSGIPARRMDRGVLLLRPCLGLRRDDLRGYLTRRGVRWIDDPSNDDPRFDRVRARRALPVLADLGIDVAALADVAANMADVRAALDWYTFLAARELVQIDGGDVLIDRRLFRTLPQETARRLLAHALTWIGGGPYPPRRAALSDAVEIAREGIKKITLHGCVLFPHEGLIWICREAAALRGLSVTPPALWDRRWSVTGDVPAGAVLRRLGEGGLRQAPRWRGTGRPRTALLAAPGLWIGQDLISAPLAGMDGPGAPILAEGEDGFFARILSH